MVSPELDDLLWDATEILQSEVPCREVRRWLEGKGADLNGCKDRELLQEFKKHHRRRSGAQKSGILTLPPSPPTTVCTSGNLSSNCEDGSPSTPPVVSIPAPLDTAHRLKLPSSPSQYSSFLPSARGPTRRKSSKANVFDSNAQNLGEMIAGTIYRRKRRGAVAVR
jgi:hypothetical protein